MIVTKIQGGLGNQMFQWAYGRSLSLRYNRDLLIDKSFYSNQGDLVRYFTLDRFNFSTNELNNISYEILKNKPIKVIEDKNYYVDNKLVENENYYLNGYWQSEKFFIESREQILKDFDYDSEKIRNISKEIDFKNNLTVSIHVRRGDYVGCEETYPVQPLKYYQNAIDYIGTYDKLIIFSDDINWCENNFNFENMVFCRGCDDIEDLTLMSKCNHNIIANSSFSWWGAQLNSNNNKKVVTPSYWYGPKMNIETKDLIPESWIKI